MDDAKFMDEYRALYPNSPSGGFKHQPELSADPRRRAAQIQYPATEAAWPAERRHDDVAICRRGDNFARRIALALSCRGVAGSGPAWHGTAR